MIGFKTQDLIVPFIYKQNSSSRDKKELFFFLIYGTSDSHCLHWLPDIKFLKQKKFRGQFAQAKSSSY